MKLLFKRHDGTFVAEVNGIPYHVTPEDTWNPDYFAEAQAVAAEIGDALGFEPPPPPPPPEVPQPPTADKICEAMKASGKTDEQINALFELASAI